MSVVAFRSLPAVARALCVAAYSWIPVAVRSTVPVLTIAPSKPNGAVAQFAPVSAPLLTISAFVTLLVLSIIVG